MKLALLAASLAALRTVAAADGPADPPHPAQVAASKLPHHWHGHLMHEFRPGRHHWHTKMSGDEDLAQAARLGTDAPISLPTTEMNGDEDYFHNGDEDLAQVAASKLPHHWHGHPPRAAERGHLRATGKGKVARLQEARGWWYDLPTTEMNGDEDYFHDEDLAQVAASKLEPPHPTTKMSGDEDLAQAARLGTDAPNNTPYTEMSGDEDLAQVARLQV